MKYSKNVGWLLIGAACLPGVVQAKPAPAASGAPAASDAKQTQSGEIIVTAQKREQRLQDVGLTVTALGGQTLREQGINSVSELVGVVPGLQATRSAQSTPIYFLRGVGLNETTVAAYPDVTTYLDQAPLSLSVYSVLTTFDLERVEVLKGPQGTLFGNNATGGAINFVAAKPTNSLHAGIDLGYARFNTKDFAAFISGPLSSTLTARLATKITEGDAWQYSYTRNDKLGKTDNIAARLLLRWRPTSDLDVTLDANGWRNRSDTQAPQLARQVTPSDLNAPIGTVGPTGTITASLPILLYPPAPHNDRAADWTPSLPHRQNNRLEQLALNANYNISRDILLTSITSYINYKLRSSSDLDGTALIVSDFPQDDANSKSFSQELRLSSTSPSRRLRWVIGGNYERTNVFETDTLNFPDASTGFEQGFSAITDSSDQKMRNAAVFGNAEYKISSALTAKGGIRYTDSQRTSTNRSFQTPGYVEPFANSPGLLNSLNGFFGFVYTPLFCPGVTYQPITPGSSITLDTKTCRTGDFHGVLKEHNISWSAGLDYKPSRDLLFYLNVSKGYKAGSFPNLAAATQAQYAPVVQESVLDYEGGVKAQLFDRKVSFNAAVFYYDYRNKQLRGKLVDPIFGVVENLINIPKSRIKGAEFDISLRPVDGLDLRLAGTYLDAKVTQFIGIVGVTRPFGLAFPVFASYQGVPLPFAPKWQGVASADYRFGVRPGVDGFIGATVTGQTKSYSLPPLAVQDVIDSTINARTLVDLRGGIRSSDDKWRVMLWGKNVFNRYYWTYATRPSEVIIRYAGRPAEYGVTVGYNF